MALAEFNISVPFASTEVSQALPAGTKKFLVRCRGNAKTQFAFAATQSSTNFITISKGSTYAESNLDLTGKTLYLQTDLASQVIEVLTWT